MRNFYLLIVSLLLGALLTGCANNVVRLSYPGFPSENISHPPPDAMSVYIVDFENKREKSAIGERQRGDQILPRTLVERWIALGVKEELSRAGYQAVVVETLSEALTHVPDYIITGEAEDVWLSEHSFARYIGSVRASISLLDGKGRHITTNSYSSVFSRTVLPVYGVPQSLLDEALFEMLQPAAKLLTRIMRPHVGAPPAS